MSVFGVILVRIFQHSDWIRRDSLSLHIQSECGKIVTRITPNTDTFYAVLIFTQHLQSFMTTFISISPSIHLSIYIFNDLSIYLSIFLLVRIKFQSAIIEQPWFGMTKHFMNLIQLSYVVTIHYYLSWKKSISMKGNDRKRA